MTHFKILIEDASVGIQKSDISQTIHIWKFFFLNFQF